MFGQGSMSLSFDYYDTTDNLEIDNQMGNKIIFVGARELSSFSKLIASCVNDSS